MLIADTITLSRETVQQVLDALKRYQVKRQDFDRFADEVSLLEVALAQPAQEPVAWQYRTRPLWDNTIRFSDWVYCIKYVFDDYTRRPVLHEWQYETRALYLRKRNEPA